MSRVVRFLDKKPKSSDVWANMNFYWSCYILMTTQCRMEEKTMITNSRETMSYLNRSSPRVSSFSCCFSCWKKNATWISVHFSFYWTAYTCSSGYILLLLFIYFFFLHLPQLRPLATPQAQSFCRGYEPPFQSHRWFWVTPEVQEQGSKARV